MERNKRLSDLGRELFSASIAITSDSSHNNNNLGPHLAAQRGGGGANPRISRTPTPQQQRNAFYALEEESEEEDADSFNGSSEDDDTDSEPTPSPVVNSMYQSPRERVNSLHSQKQSSPRWERVVPRRQVPKLQLQTEAGGIPIAVPPPSIAPSSGGLESPRGDIDSLASMEVDTKYARERNRSQYGKKNNQFKEAKRRSYNMERRDAQRAADKIRRGIVDTYDDEEHGDYWY